jgi:regulator of protease activity HflC (stomatin/prohibitin superfamily)
MLTLGGLALLSFNSFVYVVDPGEKALVMNALTGLKKTVYNQGFNLKIPFIEVTLSPFSLPSSTTPGSSPLTST